MNIALQYLRRLYDYCKTLTLPQKISYAGAVVILAGALAFLFYLNNRTDFVPLYSGLSQNDMGEIAQSLKAKKIPYHISEGSIEVAREGLYETRLSLASDVFPKGREWGSKFSTSRSWAARNSFRKSITKERSRESWPGPSMA